jgi:hypothetical protein
MGGESYPITKQDYLYGRRELSHNKTGIPLWEERVIP